MNERDLRELPWRVPAACTVLLVQGADTRALLHRISSRELEDLPAGEARATVFCDYRGRMLHAAHALGTPQGVLLVRDDAPGTDLLAWVDRHVFREDCRVADLTPRWGLRHAWGPRAAGWRESQGLAVEGARGAAPDAWILGAGPTLLWAVGEAAALESTLGAAGPSGVPEERARIEAGWPGHGREVCAEFNPYEVGLAHRVHLAKGCYTGQEALQRLVSYSSVRRRLVRVSGAGPPPAPLPLELWWGEERGGRLTSAAPTEDRGWIGLAVVPRSWPLGETRLGPGPANADWIAEALEESTPLGRRR